jgi:hypothetical protein
MRLLELFVAGDVLRSEQSDFVASASPLKAVIRQRSE